MATSSALPKTTPPKAWLMLGLGVGAQAAGSVFVSAPAFLIPLLHTERHMSLGKAGLLAAAPTLGLVLTLVAWGAMADRYGEKWIISGGLALTTLAAVGAMSVHGYLLLGMFFFLGGMAAASASAASGRVVVGWFPKERRGLAMGIRQTSQPLGVTIAALVIPALAHSHGISGAIAAPFVLTSILAVACAIGIVDPPRSAAATTSTRNPYRGNNFLLRIHIVSALLVVPQYTVSTFGLVWLISEIHWTAFAAGVVVGTGQLVGAVGRIGVGMGSDRIGSRVRPLRWVAISACTVMVLLAITGAAHSSIAIGAYLAASIVTVADNGLAFTAVAEFAGPTWSGRALGIQNTGQFIAASVVAPGVGLLIATVGYPVAFALTAAVPAIAGTLVPSEVS